MTNIILCSRHPITIAGFQAVIQPSEGFSLTVCADTTLLSKRMRDGDVQVALIDVACGITLEMLADLRTAAPAVATVLWVDGATTEFISQAIGLGVVGVLRNDAEPETCFQCLRHTAAGGAWIENDLSTSLLRFRSVSLSPRQRQLAGLLTQGLRNKEIAFRLGISEATVKVSLSRLYGKVGASDRLEFVLFALKNLAPDSLAADRLFASQATTCRSQSSGGVAPRMPVFMPTFVIPAPAVARVQ